MTRPLLKVENLRIELTTRDGVAPVIDDLSFELGAGESISFVGESGCGKSVTSMSSMQLIPRPPGRFDRGEIIYRMENGEQVNLLKLTESQMRSVRGNEIAMIFQEPMTSLNPVYTVGDQIIEAITLHQDVTAREAWKIAVSAMDDVGIPDPEGRMKAYPHQFSGGYAPGRYDRGGTRVPAPFAARRGANDRS